MSPSARVQRQPVFEYLPLRGLDYHLTRWPGDEPAATILLHGHGDCGATFQFMAEHMPAWMTLVAPDWRLIPCVSFPVRNRVVRLFFEKFPHPLFHVHADNPKDLDQSLPPRPVWPKRQINQIRHRSSRNTTGKVASVNVPCRVVNVFVGMIWRRCALTRPVNRS